MKTIDEGIHVIDTKGNTIFYNDVAAIHDGMKREEVLGKNILEVFPSLTEETSTLLKVLKTKKPIYNRAQTYKNIYGKRIETINTTLPLFVKGTFIGAMEVAKDYTKLKKLAEQVTELRSENRKINKKTRRNHYTFDDIMTKNPTFLSIIEKAKKVAKHPSPVLVYGESGVGKELIVQSIHYASHRANKPFIAQNCAALPDTLLESILFGTAKGSYTGAIERPGLFELADGGTLFLDEIHAMPMELQSKLLRILEDGFVRRVGDTKGKKVDVRIIAAMNLSPFKAMENGQLRNDLFYRLNVLSFEIPPLKERKEDILLLANEFIKSFNHSFEKSIIGLTETVKQAFLHYTWPGNVRELKHTIEYAMNFCEDSYIDVEHLPIYWKDRLPSEDENLSMEKKSLKDQVEQLEKKLIHDALRNTNGNIQQSAKLLKIPRQTLQYKIQKYQLEPSLYVLS